MAQGLGQDGQAGDDVGQGPQVPPDLLLVGQAEVGEEPDLVPEEIYLKFSLASKIGPFLA